MFHRKKPDAGDEPNRLSIEIEPNKLSWTSGSTEPEDPSAVELEDELDEDEAESGDTSEDPKAAARKAEALRAELERQAEEFGLTNMESWAIYGPNGEAVEALIESLPTIDFDTAEAIADAYESISEAERKVAQTDIRRRHRGGDLEPELQAAEQAVSDWLASLILSGDDEALFGVVANAATDAVDALVLEDDLEDVDFDTLYGPWSEVMDTDEEEEEAEEDSAAVPAAPAGKAAASAESAAEADDSDEADEGEFGPNTELIIDFVSRLASLDSTKTAELLAAWREQPKEELKAAHLALQSLADEDAKWREQLRLAQEEIFAWMDHQTTKLTEHYSGTTDARLRELAGPAVADALAALVMADMLEPEDAETLYAPWSDTVGQPELPTYEDDETD
jgi:hypothetical protein